MQIYFYYWGDLENRVLPQGYLGDPETITSDAWGSVGLELFGGHNKD